MASGNKSKLGRPREFSEQTALDAAMRVFWEKGYEGTSLDDLTAAMGINRSSLYSAFGDKEALFRKVMERYASGPLCFLSKAMEQPNARQVVESLLWEGVRFLSDPGHPRGCLSLQGGLTCGSGGESVKQTMIDWRKSGLALIQKRLEQARKQGDLPRGVNPKDLARYVMILLNGLSVQAANGATQSEMRRAVDVALRSLAI